MPSAPAQQATAAIPAFTQAKPSSKWPIAAGLLAGVAALTFGLASSGILRLGGSKPESGLLTDQSGGDSGLLRNFGDDASGLLKQNAQGDGGLLKIQGSGDSGLLNQKPPPPDTQMPKDILDWLEHLHRCEIRKVDLTQNQLGAELVMWAMGNGGATSIQALLPDIDGTSTEPDKTPVDPVKAETTDQQKEWKALVEEFNSLPPPSECVPIRNEYDQALRETGGMMLDIFGMMSKAVDDPKNGLASLIKTIGKSPDRIDKPYQRADVLIYEICKKYNTSKWFDIKSDVTGGLMNKFAGL